MKSYVGIDIGGTKMHMMAELESGWAEHTVPTGSGCTLHHLRQEIGSFLQRLPYRPGGIGIGVVGLVEGHSRIQFSDMRALNGVAAEELVDGTLPVALINDVKAATLSEAAHHPGSDTVAVIMAGTGIAVGVVSGGQLLQGARGWSGELGYMMFPVGERVQKLDEVAGGAAILRQAGTDIDTFLRKLEQDDSEAQAIIDRAGFYFGLALTNVIHLYNPDTIVIGGSTPRFKGYMDAALAAVKACTLSDHAAACSIMEAREPKRAVALGARAFISRL